MFGVGERDFGGGEGCGEWEMMGEERKGFVECDIPVVGCWVLLSHELLDVGLTLPAVGRASTVTCHLCRCWNNPGKCVCAKVQL